jgi:heme-degrading monooxygenase HmoA
MAYTIIWEFLVPPDKIKEFEAAYGPEGAWAQMFKRSPAFTGLQLLHCEDRFGRYLTLDCWESATDFENFKRNFAADYQLLDAQLQGLASAETRLGGFVTC